MPGVCFFFFQINITINKYYFCHNPILQHRPTLEHWETMVSTTAKVTIRGGLPVRKQLLFLTIQLYKMVLLLQHFGLYKDPGVQLWFKVFQPSPRRISDPDSHY